MWAAAVELRNAQRVKEHLRQRNLLHPGYLAVREMGRLYLPILRKTNVPGAQVLRVRFSFPAKEAPLAIEQVLKGKLTREELSLLPRSQEVVGSILILEIPEKLRKKERLIAEAYLRLLKNIGTVVRKEKSHEGEFRLRKLKLLAGKNTKETLHRESGVLMHVHLEHAYFTPRLANERLRIARQVKKGEEILVMFSGVGPYPLILGKHSPAAGIYGIELNPLAHQYALKNVSRNRLQHKISILEGDVRLLVPKLRKTFDRIVMPLPKSGELYLDIALGASKKGTIIHLYQFLREGEIAGHGKKLIAYCRKLGKNVRIRNAITCGQYSPGVFRVCFDMIKIKRKDKRKR